MVKSRIMLDDLETLLGVDMNEPGSALPGREGLDDLDDVICEAMVGHKGLTLVQVGKDERVYIDDKPTDVYVEDAQISFTG